MSWSGAQRGDVRIAYSRSTCGDIHTWQVFKKGTAFKLIMNGAIISTGRTASGMMRRAELAAELLEHSNLWSRYDLIELPLLRKRGRLQVSVLGRQQDNQRLESSLHSLSS